MAKIQELAHRQHGVVSRRQMLGLGISGSFVDRCLGDGRLIPVFAGTFMLGRKAETFRSVWMAATLAAGASAALYGRTAAAAWGFMDAGYTIEIGRKWSGSRNLAGCGPDHGRFVALVRKSFILPAQLVRVGPVPVTSVAGTLVQLAGTLTASRLRRAFIEASRQGLLKRSNLNHCLEMGSNFKGRRELAKLIALWHPESENTKSILEGDFLLLCSRHGIPPPLVNARVCGKEFDCVWPEHRLVVELDSRGFHSDNFAFENDRDRQNLLTGKGYSVLRFTHLMVSGDPQGVVRKLKVALERRGPNRA